MRAPWVTEQQMAPARANLEYSARPLSFSGVFWTRASTLAAAAEVVAEAIVCVVWGRKGTKKEGREAIKR